MNQTFQRFEEARERDLYWIDLVDFTTTVDAQRSDCPGHYHSVVSMPSQLGRAQESDDKLKRFKTSVGGRDKSAIRRVSRQKLGDVERAVFKISCCRLSVGMCCGSGKNWRGYS